MYKHGACHFLLLSRSATSVPATLSTACPQATFTVHRGDVSSLSDLQSAIAHPTVTAHPIRGVVHAAMVLEDAFFQNQTLESLSTVLAPKVSGLRNITQIFNSEAYQLDFLISISSLTGTLGAPSQSNYAAANAYLDAVSRHRRSLGLPAVSIALSRIAEVGYVAERRDLEASQERSGMYGLSEKEFLAAFSVAISRSPPVLITGLDPAKIRRQHFTDGGLWGENPRSSHIRSSSLYAQEATVNPGPAAQKQGNLRKATKLELIDAFVQKLAAILLVDRDQIQVQKGLGVYGVDSMVGAELRKWWFRNTGVEVGFLEMVGGSTIEGLCDTVYGMIERNEEEE